MARLALVPSPEEIAPDDVALWDFVTARLKTIAGQVAERAQNPRLGEITRALGLHTAADIATCAAELRANIAILEGYRG